MLLSCTAAARARLNADTLLEEGLRRSMRIRHMLQIGATGLLLLSAPPALADPVGECQTALPSQVDANQCLQNTLAAAQHVLDLALTEAQNHADSLDQVTGRTDARPALDQAQADWLTFRDSNCAVRGAFAGGASGSGQFIAGCAIEMTRERTDELNALTKGA
jgi:uncharacterized protein YecT (DUF1311 family)